MINTQNKFYINYLCVHIEKLASNMVIYFTQIPAK